MQAGALAVADKDEGAGPLVEHEGKILRAHHRGYLVVDPVPSDHFGGDGRGKRRLPVVIARHGIVAAIGELRLGTVKARCTLDHFVQALFKQVLHFGHQAARSAAQYRGLRDDVVGIARLHHGNRDHSRFQRVDIA